MSDSQNLGLDQLGQRVQAMADPVADRFTDRVTDRVADPRSRPPYSTPGQPAAAPSYQGSPLPIGPPSRRPIPSYEGFDGYRGLEQFDDLRIAPSPAQPAPPRPLQPVPPVPAATNPAGYNRVEPRRADANHTGASNGPETSHAATNYAGPNFANPNYNGSHFAEPARTNGRGTTAASTPGLGSGSTTGHTTETTSPATAKAAPTPLPNAALDTATNDLHDVPRTGLHRVLSAVRTTLPLVQRLLPLLEGNFATAISALVAPPHALVPQQPTQHPAPPPPTVSVDLEPVERGLAELRASQRDLRGQVLEQNVSLQRVEDQLERVREATDRNTLEQQELVEDLRSVGSRVSNLAIIGLVLLALSVGVNLYFLVQLQHILR
jgi:hypothetical protein